MEEKERTKHGKRYGSDRYHDASESEVYGIPMRPKAGKTCRACTDFKSWMKEQGKPSSSSSLVHNECPLDKDELGRQSWGLIHTMAAYYPDKPNNTQQKDMKLFIDTFAKFYPCEHCAADLRKDIAKDPPLVESRWSLCQWWCKTHNKVNEKLGKPLFDCAKVDERWLDGWKDGSCG